MSGHRLAAVLASSAGTGCVFAAAALSRDQAVLVLLAVALSCWTGFVILLLRD